ncbi:DUF602 domain-containing protein [Plectosphaerella cucumerina]|uniref:DUF602 domain-containing protein n=1 Tax=Plectosphaerella cucumerina TaxID=40658 RepID=A0A8K0X835_9PEZI|nr:DUF602 domain-containing protein [Plectosphaerella cucumerina]
MGNDGGSIPKRRELVKNAARALTHSELKANNLESLGHAWSFDPLTSDPIDLDAVVSDCRGRLYNYETVLQNLMPSADTDAGADTSNGDTETQGLTFASTGIRSLRDIVKLKFSKSTDKEKKDVRVCPLSLKELGPATKSVYLVPCGHVFADAAIRQVQLETCPECSEPFKPENIVPILPYEDAEIKKLAQRIEDLRAAGLTHALKKDKAGGKKKRKAEESKDESSEKRRATQNGAQTVKKEAPSRTSNINNPLAASLTAKVMAEQEELSRRRKLAGKA